MLAVDLMLQPVRLAVDLMLQPVRLTVDLVLQPGVLRISLHCHFDAQISKDFFGAAEDCPQLVTGIETFNEASHSNLNSMRACHQVVHAIPGHTPVSVYVHAVLSLPLLLPRLLILAMIAADAAADMVLLFQSTRLGHQPW